MSNDALADLGLEDIGVEVEVAGTETDTAEVAADAVAEVKTRVQVQVGEIEIGEAEDIIASERKGFGGGPRGSKYPFEKLPAPVKKKDGSYAYVPFTATLPEGEDWERFSRSVRSATTAQNRGHKERNEVQRFITRAVGNTAIKVYRVDDTLGGDAE